MSINWMFRALMFFSFFILSLTSSADVYKGTIGKNAFIVLDLQQKTDGSYEGRYFYNKYKQDILLSGTLQRLEERSVRDYFSPVAKSYWQGELVNNKFIGHWINIKDGKRLPISLLKIGESISQYQEDELNKNRSQYDVLKMHRKLKYSAPIVNGKVSYQWVTDPITSVKYPLIVNHPSKQKKERLNKFLMKIFWHLVLDFDACGDVANVTVNYLSLRFLDINESGSIYCGGAHPTNFDIPKTFDFSTGKLIKWSDYLYGITATKYGEEISDKALLARVQKAIKSSDDMQEECDDLISYENSLNLLSFHITEKNMITIAIGSTPFAIAFCAGDYANLPISDFKQLPIPKTGETLF